jgi:hypothetical protein
MDAIPLSPDAEQTLRAFRRRLISLALISSAIDAVIFGIEIPLIGASLGSSLVVDELVEWVISSMIARNKMDLKKRYKLAGLIPVPGVTALTIQCIIEYRQSLRAPQKILDRLQAGEA